MWNSIHSSFFGCLFLLLVLGLFFELLALDIVVREPPRGPGAFRQLRNLVPPIRKVRRSSSQLLVKGSSVLSCQPSIELKLVGEIEDELQVVGTDSFKRGQSR